jgi:carboxymethylenebutenolidase
LTVYKPRSLEHPISNGRINVVLEDGRRLPAYWSHPDANGKFPAVAVIHDWWGITTIERRAAHLLAQMGYYVIIPDLFNGRVAATPQEAMRLVEETARDNYQCVHTSLRALEDHVRVNGMVAAVGIGMGGTLAFEAALTRPDLEAAVALYGFPQKFLGNLHNAHAPILAIFGANDPYVGAGVVAQCRRELAQSPLAHEVITLPGVGHGFFTTEDAGASADAWARLVAFLEKHLKP